MKKFAVIAVVVCFMTGCTTMKGGISNYEPIGIVSIVSNKVIYWYEEEDEPQESGLGEDFLRKTIVPKKTAGKVDYSEATTLIEDANSILIEVLGNSGIAKLAPSEDVLGSAAYGDAQINQRAESFGYVKPAAYKFVKTPDKTLAVNLAKEKGIKSTMYVQFDFTKNIANGFGKSGSMRARAEMTVKILDETGKQIYNKTYEYSSPNKTEVITGAYDNDALMELFRETIYMAAEDLVYELNKK